MHTNTELKSEMNRDLRKKNLRSYYQRTEESFCKD